MYTVRSKLADAREDERGFTLREALVTMVMMLTVLFAHYSIFDASIRVFTYALSVSGPRRALLRNGQPMVEFVEPGGLTFGYLNEFRDPAMGRRRCPRCG